MTDADLAPETGPAPTRSRFSLALLGVLLLVGAGAGAYLSSNPPEDGFSLRLHGAPRIVPEISLETETGNRITLSAFRGKAILLNLWATWCPPCREEMPSLDRLQRRLGGKDFGVVALSTDSAGPDVIRAFYAQTGVTALEIYMDRSMWANSALGAPGLPTTLLIDAQGREVGRKIGSAKWDGPEAIAAIRRHLGLPTGPQKPDSRSSRQGRASHE